MTSFKGFASVCFIVAPLLAFAQSDIQQAVRLRVEAMNKIVSNCELKEATFGSSKFVRTQWTGDCKNGKLHGDGTLSFEEQEAQSGQTKYRFSQSGLAVEGRQVGPWLILRSSAEIFVGSYSWSDAPIAGHYVKSNDGTYRLAQPDWTTMRMAAVPTSQPISAAMVARHLEQARNPAGVREANKVPYQSELLRDLLRRGTVYTAPSRSIPSVGSGSVALVLSTNTARSMAKIESFAMGVRQWGRQQANPAVRQGAEKLAASADPQAFAQGLAQLLREHFKSVVFAEDLASVDRAMTDFFLVFDLQFEHEVETLMRELVQSASVPSKAVATPADLILPGSPMVGGSFFLLNRNFEVVRGSERAPYKLAFTRGVSAWDQPSPSQVDQSLAFQLDLMAKMLAETLGRDKFIYINGAQFDNTSAVTTLLRFDLREP